MRDKSKCNHKKIKKNFPFGKNSKPFRYCKICNIIITSKMLKEMKKNARFKKKDYKTD